MKISERFYCSPDYRPDVTDVVCQTEYFRPLCNSTSGQVVLINAAMYGRMRINRCVRRSFGYLGCHTDVVSIADSECSGRRTCAMQVIDYVFLRAYERGCHEDLKSYLEVQYSCVSGENSSHTLMHVDRITVISGCAFGVYQTNWKVTYFRL